MHAVQDESLLDILGTPSVSIILGARGQGKTAFGLRVLQLASEQGIKSYMMGLPEQKWELLPGYVTPVINPGGIPDNSALFIDEAYISLFAREFTGSFHKFMAKLIGLTRQRNQLFLFSSHLGRKLDVSCLYDVDNLVLRKPSFLHTKFERQEIRSVIEEGKQFFDNLDGDPRRHAYIISERGPIHVEVKLPEGWSEPLSNAFSAVLLVEHDANKKEKKRGALRMNEKQRECMLTKFAVNGFAVFDGEEADELVLRPRGMEETAEIVLRETPVGYEVVKSSGAYAGVKKRAFFQNNLDVWASECLGLIE